MRVTSVLYLTALFSLACGGSAAVDKPLDIAAAGAAGATAALPDDQVQVVDDVDHADGQYPPVPPGSSAFFWRGGLGNWFVSTSDGAGARDATVADIVPPRGTSTRGYHVSETNVETAVDLWAQLHHPQGTGVDLASYAGITFWARTTGPGAALTVAFGANGNLADVSSTPRKSFSVAQDWSQFLVRFDDLKLNSASVSSIDFITGGLGDPADLWVDDLAFLCRGKCP